MRFTRTNTTPKKAQKLKNWSAETINKRGRSSNRQFQNAIFSVYKFMKAERDHGGCIIPYTHVRERVMAALNISQNTATKYIKIGNSNGVFVTPGKVRPHKSKVRQISEEVKSEIRQVIYDCCKQRCSITIKELFHKIRENNIAFNGELETLRKVLHDIGFSYKVRSGQRHIMENSDIIVKRLNFLRRYKELIINNKNNVIFQDETWIFRNGMGKTQEWQDNNRSSCSMTKASCGPRYLICHAGGRQGFVEGASLVMCTEKKPKDYDHYHGDMNAEMFKKWFTERLLANLLDKPSIIVVDNASYHSSQEEKQPTTNWNKAELQSWLVKHGIQFNEDDKKKALYELCASHKQPKSFELEKLVQETPHTLLRLPPYHPFYNAIELVWGIAKRYYDKHVGYGNDFSEKSIIKIWNEALEQVTPEIWQKCIDKVEKRISDDYNQEVGQDFSILDDENYKESDDSNTDEEWEEVSELDFNDPETESHLTVLDAESQSGSKINHPVRRSLFSEFDSVKDICQDSLIKSEVGSVEDWIPESETAAAVESILMSNDENDTTDDPQSLFNVYSTCLGPSEDSLITTKVNMEIRVSDLRTLFPTKWLNDQVINVYFRMIERRGPNLYVFSSFFFTQLLKGYQNVRRWTRKHDIFSKNLLLIPIHLGNHWCLCTVDFTSESITYYDSLGNKNYECLHVILNYLEYEYEDKKTEQKFVKVNWKKLHASDIPQQQNLNDCGVFICTYAEYLSRKATFDFSTKNMVKFRLKILEEILSGIIDS